MQISDTCTLYSLLAPATDAVAAAYVLLSADIRLP